MLQDSNTQRNTRPAWAAIMLLAALALVTLLVIAAPTGTAAAQAGDDFELPENVTWDEVNDIASRMYCDVCEGIPLDECESIACRQWREEIARQLGAGRSEDEIFDYFVARYGDDVASMPRDESDRILAIAVPLVLLVLVGAVGARQMWEFRQRGQRDGQPARRTRDGRLRERPVPDDIDPELLDRLNRDLAEFDS
jgi:cytochrome c-type biogenesis protein CcmH/NrfF